MPIRFEVLPHERFVRVTYVGRITLRDVSVHVQRLVDAALINRPKLVDSRGATLALSPEDLRIVSSLMVTVRAEYGRAPVAFVAGDESWSAAANLYQDLGAGAIPRFATFLDLKAAEAWLASET